MCKVLDDDSVPSVLIEKLVNLKTNGKKLDIFREALSICVDIDDENTSYINSEKCKLIFGVLPKIESSGMYKRFHPSFVNTIDEKMRLLILEAAIEQNLLVLK